MISFTIQCATDCSVSNHINDVTVVFFQLNNLHQYVFNIAAYYLRNGVEIASYSAPLNARASHYDFI